MFSSIAYVSRPLTQFTDDELSELWETASENNRKLGITGGLYYDDRVFFQVLEGDEADLHDLMQRIVRDPRHTDVTVLVQNDVASPSFRFWPVKFIDGRSSPRLQSRFDPDALPTLSLPDLNSNAFMLAMS